MWKLTKAILVSSLALVTLGLMAGGQDVQAVKTLNVTNAEDIVRRWCRSPDAFVRVEELSIPMQIGPIPDDVQSACRILASQNPEVLLAAYSVLILRDYEYRFRDFSRCQYPPTHIGPVTPWEIARWTLRRLGLLGELRRVEDEGVEIGISPYIEGILMKSEEIFRGDPYGMALVERVNVLRDKLNYRCICQSLDFFRESIPSVDDVREYRFWEGKDFSFRSVRTNDVYRGSCVCLHKVEKSVGDKVLQLLATARGDSGWSRSYGENYSFRFRELDCVLRNGDTVTIKVLINDGLTSGFIISSAGQCRDMLVCPPQEIWRELSDIFLKLSGKVSGSVRTWYRSRPLPCSYRVGDGPDGGTLSGVARLFYSDASKWPAIHSANKERLPDPNNVRHGLTLTIPRLQNDSTTAHRGASAETVRRLKAITIPEVCFYAPATMKDFVEFMNQATKDFDDPSLPMEKRGIKFVCKESVAAKVGPNPPKQDEPLIVSDSFRATTAWDALTNVCNSVGCKFEVRPGKVELCE